MIIGQLILISQPDLIIETGTFKGQTTRFLSEFTTLNDLPDCKIKSFDLPEVINDLISSDPFFADNIQIEFITGWLPDSLANFISRLDQPIDFAIIDAQHSYKAVKNELDILNPHMRPGGYIFCHDYREDDPSYEGVVYAVNRFASQHGYDVLPLNSSMFGAKELVWGSAILRKKTFKPSFIKQTHYQIVTLPGRLKTIVSNLLR